MNTGEGCLFTVLHIFIFATCKIEELVPCQFSDVFNIYFFVLETSYVVHNMLYVITS